MKKVIIIARRELAGFFNSLTAYVLLGLFLGVSGFFTWMYGSDIFFTGRAELNPFFETAFRTLFFFIPAVTMRMVAEERRSGTLEVIATKAIEEWQIITGKFFACWILIVISLAFTLPYYFTVMWLGNVDHGGTIGGYSALLLTGAAYIAIGILVSSLSNNQIVAFLLTISAGLLFYLVFDILYSQAGGYTAGLFYFLSFNTHFETLSRGVADSRSIIYLLSIIAAGLYFAQGALSPGIRKS